MPDAERCEGDRQRRGEDEQCRPGDDRRGPCRLRRERGDEEHTGSDQRADVERGAAYDAQAAAVVHDDQQRSGDE
jgi:hypothetical protein